MRRGIMPMSMRFLVLASVLLVPGCTTDHLAPDVLTGPTEPGSTGAPQDGPPAVLDLGTSMLLLTEGEMVTFTAVVEDPNGPDDVVGVQLEGEGGARYGDMARAPSNRWVLALTWEEVHQVEPIEFEGELPRTFVARAVDTALREDTASTILTLTCIGIVPGACDGVCVDLDVEACP